jgi:predicted HTH domain antitoxin
MKIRVQLPDDLAHHPNPGREALEALVIQGYRAGTLSAFQASQLLDMNRFEFEGFLKDRNIFDHAYDAADFERDQQTLETLRARGLLKR